MVSKEGKNWSKILHFNEISTSSFNSYSAMGKTFKTGYPGATVGFFTFLNLYISGKLIAAQL
jgi:hypothetical protein